MNTANKLTLLRVVMIPAFLLVLYLDVPGASYWALAIFVAASLTDTLDGYIARHYNQVTDFGKFMDPLADKCLVVAAMLWFVEIGQMPAWAVLIVVIREFAVSGLRMVAADKGRVIAAGWSGKVKTASTMVCIVLMLIPPVAREISSLCVAVIVLTTIYRGGVFHQESGCAVRNKMSAFSIIACIQIREPRLSQTDGAFYQTPLKEREFENEALRSQSIRARATRPRTGVGGSGKRPAGRKRWAQQLK